MARAGRPAGAQARVKRCGKSAPAPGATRAARQTPPGARPSVGRLARPMSPGRPHRWMATQALRRWTEPRLQAGSPSPPPVSWGFVLGSGLQGAVRPREISIRAATTGLLPVQALQEPGVEGQPAPGGVLDLCGDDGVAVQLGIGSPAGVLTEHGHGQALGIDLVDTVRPPPGHRPMPLDQVIASAARTDRGPGRPTGVWTRTTTRRCAARRRSRLTHNVRRKGPIGSPLVIGSAWRRTSFHSPSSFLYVLVTRRVNSA